MKKLLIPLGLGIVGAGIGGAAGYFLKPAPDLTETAATEHSVAASETDADHAEAANPHSEAAHAETAESNAHQDDETTPGDTEFVKLNNQFIVPVLENGRVKAMVLLSLTLETPTGGKETIYAKEPRLRDGFLQVMFDYANAGGFSGTFTSAQAMDHLRMALREEGRQVMGDSVVDVLVTDIARQDG